MLHELKLTAQEQTLQCDSIKLASGLVENIECEFTLDSSWEGYDYLRALFTDNYGNVIEKTLTNNKCNVPNECLSHKGWCKVNLCAYDVVNQQKVLQMTSYMTKICDITQEVAVDGDNTVAPTVQVWEQELANHTGNTTVHTNATERATWNAKLSDAPSDSKTYGRKNGEWIEVTGGGGGSSIWGQITGTLADQTDLNTALNAKAPQSTTYTKTEVDTALSGKANTSHTHTKSQITDFPSIPSKTSDLTNDSGFLTEHQSLSAYRTSAAQDIIDDAIEADVDAIEEKIPSQASSSNQLADKSFVNSSIATNTVNYISNNGEPFTSVAQLEAYQGTVTNNDYAFVQGTDSSGNAYYDRYKASVSGSTVTWAKEFRLNNSSFTAAQWATIQSGLVSADKTKLDGIETNADVTDADNVKSSGATMGVKVAGTELTKDSDGKVDVPEATASELGVTKYSPVGGITKLNTGHICVNRAQNADITDKTSAYKPITPASLDYAIKAGLTSNSQIQSTADKKACCGTIGAMYDGQYELIESITTTAETGGIIRTQDLNGVDYNFKSAFVIIKPSQSVAGNKYVRYYDGSVVVSGMGGFLSGIATSGSYAFSKCDIVGGIGMEIHNPFSAAINGYCMLGTRTAMSKIDKIILDMAGIPTGTVFEIYAIRN